MCSRISDAISPFRILNGDLAHIPIFSSTYLVMVELRAQHNGKGAAGAEKKKLTARPVAPNHNGSPKQVPHFSSHSTDSRKNGRKGSCDSGEAGLRRTISSLHSDQSLMINDRFAYGLSRAVGLRATLHTTNGVVLEGLLHSFGPDGEVVLCSVIVISGPEGVALNENENWEFVCVAKNDVVALTVNSVPKEGFVLIDLETTDDADSASLTGTESVDAAVDLSVSVNDVSEEGTSVFADDAAVLSVEESASHAVPESEGVASDHALTDPQPVRGVPPGPRVTRQFSGTGRKWHPSNRYPREYRNYSVQEGQTSHLSEDGRKTGRGYSDEAHSGRSQSGRGHHNNNNNVRCFAERRLPFFNRIQPNSNEKNNVSNGQKEEDLSSVGKVEGKSVQSVQPIQSVQSIQSVQLVGDPIQAPEGKSGGVGARESSDRGREGGPVLNPWMSGDVWHRRNLNALNAKRAERGEVNPLNPLNAEGGERVVPQDGSRILRSFVEREQEEERSSLCREDSDNRRCLNSFRAGATPLNPDAPVFQPRSPLWTEEKAQLDNAEEEQTVPVQDVGQPQHFYPHFQQQQQQVLQPNLVPVGGMFLPLEVPPGHMHLFQHAPPSFFHTMPAGGEAPGIYVPLLPPLESYYASLLFHQMQAAHMAAVHLQMPVEKRDVTPLQQGGQGEGQGEEQGGQRGQGEEGGLSLSGMERLMDEKEFPPLPQVAQVVPLPPLPSLPQVAQVAQVAGGPNRDMVVEGGMV